jgi:hypothetical protein
MKTTFGRSAARDAAGWKPKTTAAKTLEILTAEKTLRKRGRCGLKAENEGKNFVQPPDWYYFC